MNNVRRERKKQSTHFKTLMILAIGLALLVTVIVTMLFKGKKDIRSLKENSINYSYIK